MLQLQNEVTQGVETDIQLIEVGGYHTVAISNQPKVYSWGWNDQFQLGRNKVHRQTIYHSYPVAFSAPNFRPKQIAAGDDHNILLDTSNSIYVWGGNSKGQLGLGHTKEVDRISLIDFTNGDPVVDVKAKGNSSLVVTESGAAYYWPLQRSGGEVIIRPALLSIPNKVQISHGACGYNFAILVAKNGTVYSFGTDNSAGQLGFGDTFARETPTLIQSIKNDGEKVTQAHCGFKHVICKTSLGKIYVWGWGAHGQLGLGNYNDQLLPCQVSLSPSSGYHKSKVLQVHAGYRHSTLLLENKKVYWTGSNGSMQKQNLFAEVELADKIPDYKKATEFTPLRISCTWSKSISVTYVTIADTRTLDVPAKVKDKVLSTLIQKTEESNALSDVDPPYIESIAKYFSAKYMKVAANPKIAVNQKSEIEKRKASLSRVSTTSQLNGGGHQKKLSLDSTSKNKITFSGGGFDIPRENRRQIEYNMFDSTLPIGPPEKVTDRVKRSEYGSISGGRSGQVLTVGETISAKYSNYASNQDPSGFNSNTGQRPLQLELDW